MAVTGSQPLDIARASGSGGSRAVFAKARGRNRVEVAALDLVLLVLQCNAAPLLDAGVTKTAA
jgi:hypothetical protein